MSGDLTRILLIFGPVVGLFFIGLCVTLRSGVYSIASFDGLQKVAGNFTRTVVLLAGCLLGMAVLQQIVGYRLPATW